MTHQFYQSTREHIQIHFPIDRSIFFPTSPNSYAIFSIFVFYLATSSLKKNPIWIMCRRVCLESSVFSCVCGVVRVGHIEWEWRVTEKEVKPCTAQGYRVGQITNGQIAETLTIYIHIHVANTHIKWSKKDRKKVKIACMIWSYKNVYG